MSQLFSNDNSLSADVDNKCFIANRNELDVNKKTTKAFTPSEDICDPEETINTSPKNYVKTLENTTTPNDSQSQNPSQVEIFTLKKIVPEERVKHLKETSSPPILALSNILTNSKPDVMQKLFNASQQHSVESYGNCAEPLHENSAECVDKASVLRPCGWVTLPGMETEQRREELRRILNERQKKCHESDQ